jgi:hypothetical protein
VEDLSSSLRLTRQPIFYRHPELVSGSIVQPARPERAEKWTLKQVQGDGKVE